MKKFISELSIGLVCLLLGFLIICQLKAINNKMILGEDKQSSEVLVESEQLLKQVEELQKKVAELTEKNKDFETAAVRTPDETILISEQLQEMKLAAGVLDVKGEGITVDITPKKDRIVSPFNNAPIIDYDLLTIVNNLRAANAEAISINDIRVTASSGIRTAGDYGIIINNQRIPSHQHVVIKAIGNKVDLEGIMKFQGTISEELSRNCDITVKPSNNVVVKRSQVISGYQYAKQVND